MPANAPAAIGLEHDGLLTLAEGAYEDNEEEALWEAEANALASQYEDLIALSPLMSGGSGSVHSTLRAAAQLS